MSVHQMHMPYIIVLKAKHCIKTNFVLP